jgi:hypothetical protein
VNAHQRFHGLIVELPGLDFTTLAREPLAWERDRTMNRPHPRSTRLPAHRFGRACRTPSSIARLMEEPPLNPHPFDTEVRHDLVNRVRQEIQAGTYDTPEKLEAALDRLASRLSFD